VLSSTYLFSRHSLTKQSKEIKILSQLICYLENFMASSQSNRVISYFFIFDFYHNKDSNDGKDLFPESIIYFYPTREDIKKEVKLFH